MSASFIKDNLLNTADELLKLADKITSDKGIELLISLARS